MRYRLEVVPVSLRCYGGHRCCEVPSWGCPCVCEVLWWTQVLWGAVLRSSLCPWGVMVGTGAVRCRLEVVLVSLRCYGGHRCCEYRLEVVPVSLRCYGGHRCCEYRLEVVPVSLRCYGGHRCCEYRLEVVPVSLRCYGGHRCSEVPSWGCPCVPEVLWWTQVLWGTVLRSSLCPWGVMVGTGAVRYRLEVVPVSLRCYSGHRCSEVPSWGCPCVCEVL